MADLTAGNVLDPRSPDGRIDVGKRGVLLAVSDGMGGHASGEVASALVVQTLTRSLANPVPSAPVAHVKDAVQQAHATVQEAAHDDHDGMGATLTALLVEGTTATIAEVGDSRAYLIRGGEIVQLTHDQSYTQLLLDAGIIRPDQVAESPMRNVLLQAMGDPKPISAEIAEIELRDRDCLVICSDGLTNEVSEEDIRNVVLCAPNLHAACASLVDLANERGGRDDMTVIVAGVAGAPPNQAGEDVHHALSIVEAFEARAG